MAAHDTGPILAILDPQWRPRHLVPLQQDWRIILRRLLRDDGSWVALVQRRPDDCSPLPCPADIALTRAINRRVSVRARGVISGVD